MNPFVPRSVTFRGRVVVRGDVDTVFPLFSPEGERQWVPHWDPELLYPPGVPWQQGQIFRTREESGVAIWLVTRLDHARHTAEYHRVEPNRYVARIEVGCRQQADDVTEATIAYSFVGLSEEGNQVIAAMTPEAYETKMSRWASWLERHRSGGPIAG